MSTTDDGKRYSVTLQTYGDNSDKNKTARIGEAIVNATDFMLAGYSSSLTEFLAPIAQENGRLMVTGGSSLTSLHAENDLVFGILPPSGSFLDNAFKGISAKGAKTVAYLTEEDVNSCLGAEELAETYGMIFLEGKVIPEDSPREVFEAVAKNMSLLDPDMMITCIRTSFDYWNNAMRSVDWSPKAQVYTMVIGTPEFEDALGEDLPFVMGLSSWDRALPPIPDGATGWTPFDFDAEFLKKAFRRPAYQHVSQSAAVSVLLQAIERVGTVNFTNTNLTQRVRHELATGYFSTVFGNTSFDSNGQQDAPYLFLQYDANHTLHVLLPEDRKYTRMELVYPSPTWAWRDCHTRSTCLKTNGTCAANGTCSCSEDTVSMGSRDTAMCIVPPEVEADEFSYVVAIGIPVIVVFILAMGWIVNSYCVHDMNDAVWKVEMEELIFAKPPEVIGCGTFGMVLLAEYRGTKVAVKKVLPPSRKSKHRESVRGQDSLQVASSPGHSSTAGYSSGASSLSESSQKEASRLSMLYKKGNQQSQQDFIEEMRQVSKLRHPFVTTVMGAVVGPGVEPMLVLEYMEVNVVRRAASAYVVVKVSILTSYFNSIQFNAFSTDPCMTCSTMRPCHWKARSPFKCSRISRKAVAFYMQPTLKLSMAI